MEPWSLFAVTENKKVSHGTVMFTVKAEIPDVYIL